MKQIISNRVKMGVLLEFEAAFPNEKRRTPQEYLQGGSRNIILHIASFFLGFKSHKSEFQKIENALGLFFRKENQIFASEIYKKVKELSSKSGPVFIFNSYSSLKLFEIFFQEAEEKETQTEIEFEINLFKAYLAINSEYTKKQFVAFTFPKDLDKELEMIMSLFCASYSVSDKINYDITEIWTVQMVKAILFFQFLEQRAKDLLTAFLLHFNCKTWEEFLKRLLPTTISAIKNDREANTDIIVEPGEHFNEGCEFIEKLIVKDDDVLNENDFISLRNKPFYKIHAGTYRIIFNLFVVEKIFKGIYFFLLEVNKSLPPASRFEIKSFFGNEFSEKTLLYKVVGMIYSDKCLSYSGKDLDDKGITASPDYYVRKGTDILLFESKDFLIPAAAKDSCDFSQYQDEFEKKLYFQEIDGKEKHKAVMQLINNIKRLLRMEFIADTGYKYREITIYPILITHDHQYDVVGFNYLINYWFQEELENLSEEGLYIHKIKPLVVVNIDSLIYHQVALQKISLHEIIKKYVEHVRIPRGIKMPENEVKDYLLNKTIPFSGFLTNYLYDRKLKEYPPLLKELGFELFKNEEHIVNAH
jgi:hypothetical protein